ncbi:MAG TPA: hypothetical protein PLA94_29360, partial [Myxococcota bacterium]|nr:hypothetical protein [Myxococcota bacterium]
VLSPGVVWWIAALCLGGERAQGRAWLERAGSRIAELVPGYGDILLYRLRRAAGLEVAAVEPAPPEGGPPPDARSLLLRVAGSGALAGS